MDKIEKTITIKWVKSASGRPRYQRETIQSLGLRRLHQTVTLPDRPEVRGQIQRVMHLLEVQK